MKALTILLLLNLGVISEGDANGGNQRPLRKNRWMIIMPKDNPAAFLKKMADLQAILLLPDDKNSELFSVCENLEQRPVMFRPINRTGINALNRLWFTSHDEAGRKQLAQALQLNTVPTWFAFFIPVDLEAELLRKELAHEGLTEVQLNARKMVSLFVVERKGTTWDIRVLYQGQKKQ